MHADEPANLRKPCFPRRALLLIAHGSRLAEANEDLSFLVDELRKQQRYGIVEAAFLELAEPNIEAGGARCIAQGASEVILVPYFLSAGIHVLRDLSEARNQLAGRFPDVQFRLAKPLGRHPLLLKVVIERAVSAEDGKEVAPWLLP